MSGPTIINHKGALHVEGGGSRSDSEGDWRIYAASFEDGRRDHKARNVDGL